MARLENARHEAFAQALAKGKSATAAYIEAGYTPSRSAASRLLTNVSVERRVAELLAKAAEKVDVTAETIARQLDEDRELAIRNNQASAAVSASMGKAKLFGLLVEKVQAEVKHSFTDLADGELDFEIAALIGETRQTAH